MSAGSPRNPNVCVSCEQLLDDMNGEQALPSEGQETTGPTAAPSPDNLALN